jgi:two-component system response regulator AtoC
MEKPRILVLDHPSPSLRALSGTLQAQGFEVSQTERPAEARRAVQDGECAVLLGAVSLAAEALVEALETPSEGPPVILFEDFGDSAEALSALDPFETLERPVSAEQVLRVVRRAIESHTLRVENARLRDELAERHEFGSLTSADPRMRRIFETLAAVADSRATLLLTGESGTGKTQLAHAVHARSARAQAPFIEVNCGAIPAALQESELFGHVRGAFTGAVRDRAGKFEQATGGTILLDEIGTATPELQVKLLRVLEEGRYERVGDTRTREVDARVIAATNADLEAEVARGRFRADLFYRIHVVPIEVPPLRERAGDIPLLAQRFAARFARNHGRELRGLSEEALRALCRHPWPGNVRELENALERAVLVAAGARIEVEHLWPGRISERGVASVSRGQLFAGWSPEPPDDLKAALEGPERWLLERALGRCGGNRSAAARLLGIDRSTLFNKMRRYDLLSFPIERGGPSRP